MMADLKKCQAEFLILKTKSSRMECIIISFV